MAVQDIEILRVNSLRRRIKVLREAITDDKILDRIGLYVVTRIKERTAAGKDVDGEDFKPYSDQYAFFRQSRGRPIDNVDLFFTGSMLGALTHEVNSSDKSVRIFFMPGQDFSGQSNPAKAFYLNQERNFFGISEEDELFLFETYVNWVQAKGNL